MPVKKSKRSKKSKQSGGWFWERDDPIFGASNRWIGDKVITPTNNFLKKTKILSSIAGPVGTYLGGPLGGVAGAVAGVGLKQLGYGINTRPTGKAPQHGSGTIGYRPPDNMHQKQNIYKTLPYPVNVSKQFTLQNMQRGGNSPFLLTHNSSFNSIKL